MKREFKAEKKIINYEFERIPKDIIEKKFIIDFLSQIPIEDLKRLINYKEINYNDEKLWRISPEMSEKLSLLRYERVILLQGSVFLDDGGDDSEYWRCCRLNSTNLTRKNKTYEY